MAQELTPDICVIGGGPGGVAVATGAAALGLPVVLIEKGAMGGANLAYGGVPSAALLAAADAAQAVRRAAAMGAGSGDLPVNLAEVEAHVEAARRAVAPNLSAARLTALGVTVLSGAASFADRRTVKVGDTSIRARRFVVATGSKPSLPAVPGLDTVEAITVETAFEVTRKPAHLLVFGAGPRGLALAQAYNRLGIGTTVIDSEPALAGADPELAAIVRDRLRAEGVRVRDRLAIAGVARYRGGVRVTLAGAPDGLPIDGSHILVARGRAPNVDGLGLEAARIEHDASGIVVDRLLRTSNSRVYAIGDVVAGPALASRARYQAERVLRAIVYRLPSLDDPAAVPQVTHTDPALAVVGFAEEAARRRFGAVRVLRFPLAENDRAAAEGSPEGLLKVITTRGGRVLGAAIVARDAAELIGIWSLAVSKRLDIAALARFVPAYPTLSETARGAAESFTAPGLVTPWRLRLVEFLRKFG